MKTEPILSVKAEEKDTCYEINLMVYFQPCE